MSMNGAGTWYGRVNQNGAFSILARVCSLDGTGPEVLPPEGNTILQADVVAITCKIFALGTDKNNPAGVEETPTPTLSPGTNILDTLSVSGWPTDEDEYGYNFRHDVVFEYVPASDVWYLLEYRFVLTNGAVIWLRAKVKTVQIQTP